MDKVYLYDDKLVVSMWFSEDDKQEITWRDWFSLDEYWTDESPFVKGGSVEFDCFPSAPHDKGQPRQLGWPFCCFARFRPCVSLLLTGRHLFAGIHSAIAEIQNGSVEKAQSSAHAVDWLIGASRLEAH